MYVQSQNIGNRCDLNLKSLGARKPKGLNGVAKKVTYAWWRWTSVL